MCRNVYKFNKVIAVFSMLIYPAGLNVKQWWWSQHQKWAPQSLETGWSNLAVKLTYPTICDITSTDSSGRIIWHHRARYGAFSVENGLYCEIGDIICLLEMLWDGKYFTYHRTLKEIVRDQAARQWREQEFVFHPKNPKMQNNINQEFKI